LFRREKLDRVGGGEVSPLVMVLQLIIEPVDNGIVAVKTESIMIVD